MPDDTPVRSRLYDMARDIIEKPTNKNIITLRDEALRMHDDSQKWAHQADALELETDRLKTEVDKYHAALTEIQKGEGPFSVDHLTHASNTIDAMKELATDAIKP